MQPSVTSGAETRPYGSTASEPTMMCSADGGAGCDDEGQGGPRMATSDLTSALDKAGVSYELLPHAHTESALAEAESLGVSPHDVAKTLIVKLAEGYVRAVLPASARIDVRKVRELHGGGRHKVHLATEEDLRRDYPEFELGAVPPLGGRSDPVIVDPKLAARTSIVIEAGSHDESVRIAAADLVHVTGAAVTDISED
jgi:Ala-tRNA(Pro) deacylase